MTRGLIGCTTDSYLILAVQGKDLRSALTQDKKKRLHWNSKGAGIALDVIKALRGLHANGVSPRRASCGVVSWVLLAHACVKCKTACSGSETLHDVL